MNLTSEQEDFVAREVRDGAYSSEDQVLAAAFAALAQKRSKLPIVASRKNGTRALNLADLLLQEPWAGSDLDITRDQSSARDLEL